MMTEPCPFCYGDGCPSCHQTGIITHGPYAPCGFCQKDVCGCPVCQAYCTCRGYWDYYIGPYLEEVRGDDPR